MELKLSFRQGFVSNGDSSRKSISCLSQLLEASRIPWLMAHLQLCPRSDICFHCLTLTPCLSLRRTLLIIHVHWMIQDNHPISTLFTYSRLQIPFCPVSCPIHKSQGLQRGHFRGAIMLPTAIFFCCRFLNKACFGFPFLTPPAALFS